MHITHCQTSEGGDGGIDDGDVLCDIYVFQVCMRRYLREIWVLLHLTGECDIRSFGLHTQK